MVGVRRFELLTSSVSGDERFSPRTCPRHHENLRRGSCHQIQTGNHCACLHRLRPEKTIVRETRCQSRRVRGLSLRRRFGTRRPIMSVIAAIACAQAPNSRPKAHYCSEGTQTIARAPLPSPTAVPVGSSFYSIPYISDRKWRFSDLRFNNVQISLYLGHLNKTVAQPQIPANTTPPCQTRQQLRPVRKSSAGTPMNVVSRPSFQLCRA